MHGRTNPNYYRGGISWWAGLKGDDIENIINECGSMAISQYLANKHGYDLANKHGYVLVKEKVYEAMREQFFDQLDESRRA